MTSMHMPTMTRSRRALLAVLAAVVTTALLLPLGGTSSAQDTSDDPRVIDPTDPCHVPAPPAPFSDRGQIADVHLASVDCAFVTGITQGVGNGDRYAPTVPVRRDQMASYILRTLEAAGGVDVPAPSDQGFSDISGNVHEDAINQLAALGVTEGRTETLYEPATPVRRDQMASFIVRAADVAFGTTFEAVDGPYFGDVSASNVHSANIAAAYELFGLTVGQSSDTFATAATVRRDQMATFLIRLLDITVLSE